MALRFQSPTASPQPSDQTLLSLPHFPFGQIPITIPIPEETRPFLNSSFNFHSVSPLFHSSVSLCFSSGGNIFMATDEFHKPHVTLPPAPSIHQYPEMIMAAIEALNEPNGSNKSTISRHMESTYGDLPAAHPTLLSHNLTKLKNSGQLVFIKNNYMKPDPNAPPKRGRGRPPKPKDPLSSATAVSSGSPRPRGRPPKARDPFAPVSQPKKVSAGSGRPRGRPPKDKPEGISAPPAGARGRGRPPKIKPAVAAVGC